MREEKFSLEAMAKQEDVKGFEGIDSNAVSVPFIKLLQQLSPELNAKKTDVYNPEAKIGMFINSVTKELLSEKFKCIVIGFERVFVEWLPDRGGLVGYHTPAEAGVLTVCHDFAKWRTAEGNPLIENYMYRVLIEGKEKEGIAVLALTSSNITVAKAWNRQLMTTLMDNGAKALPHFIKWEVSSEYTEKKDNSWYKISVKKVGFINEKQYKLVSDERKTIGTKQVEYTGEERANKDSADKIVNY